MTKALHDKVIIFDIDGVLIEPHGYRDAVPAAMRFWLPSEFPDHLLPGKHEFDQFESFGMTNEWDMLVICMGILATVVVKDGKSLENAHLADLSRLMTKTPLPAAIDYLSTIKSMGAFYQREGLRMPNRAAMYRSPAMAEVFPPLFGTRLYDELMLHTDDIQRSEIIQTYQTCILGDALFETSYGLKALFESPSYLATRDIKLISDAGRQRIMHMPAAEGTGVAMMTARASRPAVVESGEYHTWYSPEAELAMRLLGFESLPVVASGQLRYISLTLDCNAQQLVKPSPFHALTAILAAFGIPILSALSYAAGLSAKTKCGEFPVDARMPGDLESYLPRTFHIHVVEDSYIGIESAQKAANILRLSGFDCTINAWGVATAPDKVDSLQRRGAVVFDHVHRILEEM